MHPAKSVIFFTVVSGLGLGLYIVGGALWVLGGWQPNTSDSNAWLFSATVALIAGLASSSFHLANPKNAWRAWMRFRTSWLSREAVLAVAVIGVAFLLWLKGADSRVSVLLAGVLSVLALLTLYSTGMIYACLKTIRQWHTPLTPAYYLLAGCSAGSVMFAAMFDQAYLMSWVLLFAAAAVKIVYYGYIGRPAGPSLETSTGLGNSVAGVRLLEVGHSGNTFLTREFGGQLDESKVNMLRAMVFVFSLLLPAGALLIGAAPLALLMLLAGHAVERWLFFAEAKHVVRLYHGQET
ncbi:MAG: dimethyl sulfoxide reductase anchor subunit family protein [Granulosicoccaceae bacterium]